MTDKSSCIIYKVKSCLGSSLCHAHGSRIYPCFCLLSWFDHYPIWYHLCLPSFIQFLVTLVICWRICCLPYHSMVPFSVLPDGKDLEFWRSYLRIHFYHWWIPLLQLSIIIYWLTNYWILSMFDFSLPLFAWLGLYWFFGILYEDLSSHLWTKLRNIMFYQYT